MYIELKQKLIQEIEEERGFTLKKLFNVIKLNGLLNKCSNAEMQ